MAEIPATQRAYTLRLRGRDRKDPAWRDALWSTHEAVNRGAQAFGDWLLTLRGGIDHKLADVKNATERRNRRIVLALSWLSVESKAGSPAKRFHVSAGATKTVKSLADILRLRRVSKSEIESWLTDCSASLSAAIRPDAVWVNRSAMFDECIKQVGKSMSRHEVWDLFNRFFGSQKEYFEGIVGSSDKDEEVFAEEDKAKDLAQKARGWLSNRFGSGAGTDFEAIAEEYSAFGRWCRWIDKNAKTKTSDVGGQLAKLMMVSVIPKRLASTPGPPNRVQTTYQQIVDALANDSALPKVDYANLAEEADKQARAKRTLIGRKQELAWATKMQKEVIRDCRLPYRDEQAKTALINEYSVILDHAARRVCMAHSWIKRAETTRQSFTDDARKLDELTETTPAAATYLNALCKERTTLTNAVEPYRIRRGAISDWELVVKKWSRKSCATEEDRIAAAREVQTDPENEKPGDNQLYELLASENARCVWQRHGKSAADILKNYVAATDAIAKQRRFKVPAYRHPDSLSHPVFCDFGESRWGIDFAPHRASRGCVTAQAKLARKQAAVEKATQAIDKAKTDTRRAAAQEKLKNAEIDLAIVQHTSDFLKRTNAVRLGLFNGSAISTHELRWQSKRLINDLSLQTSKAPADTSKVSATRADRFGRVVAGATDRSAVAIRELFDMKEWNGRLQAPRVQLNEIAAVRDGKRLPNLSPKDRATKVAKMISRLRWLITFSAKLQPQGPWYEFVAQLPREFTYNPKKRRLYHSANKSRKGRAQFVLARLPGLRLLSVDLGHRYAAACAVWLTLSTKELLQECQAAGASEPAANDLFHIIRQRKKRATYRRIGPDRLQGGKAHPAPWAKLERQFLVKLPGEKCPARKASASEIAEVQRMERELGYRRLEIRKPSQLSVDVLMNDAVRVARLGLARHRRRAKIAFQVATDWMPGMGQKKLKLSRSDQTDLLVKALVDWHDLATDPKWEDKFSARLWQDQIIPLLHGEQISTRTDEEVPQARKKRLLAVERTLRPVAECLADRTRTTLRESWSRAWTQENRDWRKRLRQLRDWLLPRSKQRGDASIRHVGGLSVRRIATIKDLYQVQKAFRTQPEPDDPTKNIPDKDDHALDNFGKRILTTIDRLRENRVKQLSSRLIEAALGVGAEPQRYGKRQPCRSRRPTHPQCHVIVIENLKNYRPDELLTRRENRQLMSWASAKVRKYLDEGCQLYGLHLCEVPAAYTSRQDSRTGGPGIRCNDIAVTTFLSPHFLVRRAVNDLLNDVRNSPRDWDERLLLASEQARNGAGCALNRYIVDLFSHWQKSPEANRRGKFVRIPQRGGEIFASADGRSPIVGGLHADLNAAANIGVKALMDPDWLGAWWYVPCDGKTMIPLAKSTEGSSVFAKPTPLVQPATDGKEKAEPVNLWADVSADVTTKRNWCVYAKYKSNVEYRVINKLRKKNNL